MKLRRARKAFYKIIVNSRLCETNVIRSVMLKIYFLDYALYMKGVKMVLRIMFIKCENGFENKVYQM